MIVMVLLAPQTLRERDISRVSIGTENCVTFSFHIITIRLNATLSSFWLLINIAAKIHNSNTTMLLLLQPPILFWYSVAAAAATRAVAAALPLLLL